MIRPAMQDTAAPRIDAPPCPVLLMTPAEVRDALRLRGREDQVVRRLQRQGLRVLKIAGRLRVQSADLAAFVEGMAEDRGATR